MLYLLEWYDHVEIFRDSFCVADAVNQHNSGVILSGKVYVVIGHILYTVLMPVVPPFLAGSERFIFGVRPYSPTSH